MKSPQRLVSICCYVDSVPPVLTVTGTTGCLRCLSCWTTWSEPAGRGGLERRRGYRHRVDLVEVGSDDIVREICFPCSQYKIDGITFRIASALRGRTQRKSMTTERMSSVSEKLWWLLEDIVFSSRQASERSEGIEDRKNSHTCPVHCTQRQTPLLVHSSLSPTDHLHFEGGIG